MSNKLSKLILFVTIISLFILMACGQAPSKNEVAKIVFKKVGSRAMFGSLILDLKIEEMKKIKVREKKAYAVTVSSTLIEKGLLYGYLGFTSRERYYQDKEVHIQDRYLIAKNDWDEWVVLDSIRLSRDVVKEIQRPENQAFKDYYKDRINFKEPN